MIDIDEGDLRILHEAVSIQARDCLKESWLGFLWHEVHASPQTLNKLVSRGLLSVSPYSSRTYTYYFFDDLDKAQRLVLAYDDSAEVLGQEEPLVVPHNLFDVVVGRDQDKNLFKMALAASDPVHILLEGPPASGKSLFLSELGRLPASRMALGGTSSRAGIVDFLIDMKPKYLIMDEIEKANQNDMDVLLSLMESGQVTRLKKGMRESITLRTWVFAGANSTRYLSPALLSRFITRQMPEYSEQDFCDVSFGVLTKRENLDPAWTNLIIAKLKTRTNNPRDAVKVGRLLQDISQLDEVISMIWP